MQIYELIKEDKENANYGVRRIHDYLRLNKGYLGGIHTIRRIGRENNLMIRPKHRPNGITKADAETQKTENLIIASTVMLNRRAISRISRQRSPIQNDSLI